MQKQTLELGASLPSAPVSAVRVCSSAINGAIRGIEIRGDTRRADGSYWNQVDQDLIRSPTHLMCGKDDDHQFGELSRCAGNQLATGFVVHWDNLWTLVGLQLICRAVEDPD
jgi:hypothetical protein